MRLITRKVYRAFPELDASDDAQCRRFVAAANGAFWKVALRAAAIFAVGAGLTPLAVAAAVLLSRELIGGPVLADFVSGTMLAVLTIPPLAVVCVLALLVRDLLLRLGVRRIMIRCGQCWHCRYTLLGMPVGEDCRVTCPECGSVTTADPALGELSREGGSNVYRPVAHREDPAFVQRRRLVHRRVTRWAARTAAVLTTLVAIGYGILWAQALAARRGARVAAELARMRTELRDPSVSDDEAARRWGRYSELCQLAARHVSPRGHPNFSFLPIALNEGFSRLDFQARYRRSNYDSARSTVRDAVAAARADGTMDVLAELPQLLGATRPLDPRDESDHSWIVNNPARFTRLLLLGELEVAMLEADLPRYLAAIRTLNALQAIQWQQGDAWPDGELYVAIGLHVPRYPGTEWVAGVEAALVRSPWHDPTESRHAVGALHMRAQMGRTFSDPHMPIGVLLGMRDAEPYLWRPNQRRVWTGLYWENAAALELHTRDFLAAESSQPDQRVAVRTIYGLPIVDEMARMSPQALSHRLTRTSQMQRVWLSIRVERFRLERGRLPTSLREALGPVSPDAPDRWLVDELTGETLVLVPCGPGKPGDPATLPFDIVVESDVPPAEVPAAPAP